MREMLTFVSMTILGRPHSLTILTQPISAFQSPALAADANWPRHCAVRSPGPATTSLSEKPPLPLSRMMPDQPLWLASICSR